jgi:hypothetical protein
VSFVVKLVYEESELASHQRFTTQQIVQQVAGVVIQESGNGWFARVCGFSDAGTSHLGFVVNTLRTEGTQLGCCNRRGRPGVLGARSTCVLHTTPTTALHHQQTDPTDSPAE